MNTYGNGGSRLEASLTNYLPSDSANCALRSDVLHGLLQSPKSLPPKWSYDEVGSALFDQITRLDEYYLTRTELAILSQQAATIAEVVGAETLIDLGSGTSEKTRMLLRALRAAGTLRRFVPYDVDVGVLESTAEAIAVEFPGVQIEAVCGDFEEHLAGIPTGRRRLIAFLGSTIGNLTPDRRARFFAALAEILEPGDGFLLGVDLVKDVSRLLRAYDDDLGVSAAFDRNVLSVVNRELNADFAIEEFENVARWNAEQERVEIWLRSTREQCVRIESLDMSVSFEAGEEMLTGVSCKFRPETVTAEFNAAGLRHTHWWTDSAGDFGLALAVK